MKSKLIFVGVLWLIALLSAANYFVLRPLVDEAGIAVNQSQTALAAEPGQGQGQGQGQGEGEIPSDSTTATAVPIGAGASSVFGSVYNVTKNIPPVVSQNYSTFHWFLYPLPLIVTVWVIRWRRGLNRKYQNRLQFLLPNLRTILIGPSVKDTNRWESSDTFWEGLHDMLAGLSQNTPKYRTTHAVPVILGVAAHSGEGISYYAQVPVPSMATTTATPSPATSADLLPSPTTTEAVMPDDNDGTDEREGEGEGEGEEETDEDEVEDDAGSDSDDEDDQE
jgi:hypothetical protein